MLGSIPDWLLTYEVFPKLYPLAPYYSLPQ